MRRLRFCLALTASAAVSAAPAAPTLDGPQASRAIIEHAVARWRVFAGTPGLSQGSSLAAFAPDSRSFTAVVFRGVPHTGLNEYQLRLFRLAADDRWTESTLLTLETPGNDPAIQRVRWIGAGRLGFLGSPAGMQPQVHTFDVASGRLMQRTFSPGAIISYDFSRDGSTLVYAAHTLASPFLEANDRAIGMVPRPEDTAWTFGQPLEHGPEVDVYVVGAHDSVPRRVGIISTSGSIRAADLARHGHAIRVSPDGEYALLAPYYDSPVPSSWTRYKSEDIRLYLDAYRIPAPTYAIIHLRSGKLVPLGIAVAGDVASGIAWAADSRHVFVAGYLPPEHPRFGEVDEAKGAVLSVAASTQRIEVVATGAATIAAVAESGASVTLIQEAAVRPTDDPRVLNVVQAEKRAGAWRETSRSALPLAPIHRTSAVSATASHLVGIVESSDAPTELAVLDLGSRRVRTITMLNPALAALPRGRLEPRQDLPQSPEAWPAQLVKPIGYVPGKRYPAVVMHMDRRGHSDGYVLDSADYRAAYPIQALANRGIAVLMVWFPRGYWALSGAEKRRQARGIADIAYDHLVRTLAVADPNAIAMTGFSHAGWITEYGLQHSRRPYAAAVAIDNWTASYLQYVFSNTFRPFEEFYDGTSPFSPEGRSLWWNEAVGFNPQKSLVPLMKESHGDTSPVASIAAWEIYAGARRFGRPIELVYYPDGMHILRRVPEQISAAERQVDWLCFWLKDEEDPSPSKEEQYRRWRLMKEEASRSEGEPE